MSEDTHDCSPVLFDVDTPMYKQIVHPSLLHLEQQHQQSTTQIKPVVFGASAEEVVEEIRFRIEQKTRLTASAGKQIYIYIIRNILKFHNTSPVHLKSLKVDSQDPCYVKKCIGSVYRKN